MQIKLTIALVAAAFALASYPASAADMPADGTKNFTAPGDAPSYFTNETVPATARVANQATFTEVEEATAPEEPATDRGSKRASARKSTKHASGKSKGSGGSTHYTKASSSKSNRSELAHSTGGRSASAATGSGKSGAPAGAGKAKTTKQAKSGIRQQAAAVPRTTAASFA
jgi:hypothetical protein